MSTPMTLLVVLNLRTLILTSLFNNFFRLLLLNVNDALPCRNHRSHTSGFPELMNGSRQRDGGQKELCRFLAILCRQRVRYEPSRVHKLSRTPRGCAGSLSEPAHDVPYKTATPALSSRGWLTPWQTPVLNGRGSFLKGQGRGVPRSP